MPKPVSSVIIYGDVSALASTLLPILWSEAYELTLHTTRTLDVYREVADRKPDLAILLPGASEEAEAKLGDFLSQMKITTLTLGRPDKRGIVDLDFKANGLAFSGRFLAQNLRLSLTPHLRHRHLTPKVDA